MSAPLTPQQRHRYVMSYWRPRGLKPRLGTYHITPAMEREALAWHEQRGEPITLPDVELEVQAAPAMIDDGKTFWEPGQGAGKAAVLCPGPSLAQSWGAGIEGYDVVLGVNNAAAMPCDWWVSHDHGPLEQYECDPRVGILTNASNVGRIKKGSLKPKVPDLSRLRVVDNRETYTREVPRMGGWSRHSAIMLAARLGCPTVDVYGDDREGNRYYDGRVNTQTKPSRWKRESDQSRELEKLLQAQGVTVRRIAPPEQGGED